MQFKGKISSVFWKGLFTLLPLYLTLYFIVWLLQSIEATLKDPLQLLLGTIYFPGLGLITAFVIIFVIGLLMQVYITQYLNHLLDRLISKLPVVGDIYNSLQTMIKYLTASAKPKGQDVVMVQLEAIDAKVLGIVTRTDFEGVPDGMGGKSDIAVFIPMSYQIGGFTIHVPKERVSKIDLSPKEALKWAFIGGIKDDK